MRSLVVLVCIAACGKRVEVRDRSSELIALEGDGAFGNQAVTTTSAPKTFVVRPASDALQRDLVESIESTCPEFQVDAPGAAGAVVERVCTAFGGGSYGGGGDPQCIAAEDRTFSFRVRFAPIVELPSSSQCRIIVRTDGGASRSIPVSGTGIPPPLSADIAPRAAIDFFTVNLDTTSAPPRKVTVKNTGSQTLSVSSTFQLANGVFAITGAPSGAHTLQPNQTETYNVTCTPNAVQVFTGALTINTNDPDAADSLVTIPFSCQGIDHPIGNTDDGEILALVGTSQTVSVKLANLSVTDTVTGLAVALAQPALPGLEITGVPATTLAPLAETIVTLTWTPPEPYKGALGGLLLNIDGKPERPIGIAMSHATIADVVSDTPANEKLDFGRVCIGETKRRSFEMGPGGTDSNVFAGYAITGATSMTPFSASVVGPATVAVSPAAQVEIEVATMPMFSDGRFDGTVVVATTSPSEPTLEVPITVEVLQGGTTVNPPLLNFREVVVTGFSETKTATFSNCTPGDIEVTGVTLDGDSASDFEIVPSTKQPPFTLARGSELEIEVQMLPQSDGTKEAQISIDFQEPGKPTTSSETVALLGEGFLRTPDRDSYYRCSTGSPNDVAPIGLVFAFMIRRRRRRR